MARGWESKAVETQMEDAAGLESPERSPGDIDRELKRQRNSLMLSRHRITQDMETCRSPRYKEILAKALVDLDEKIADLN